MAWWIALLCVMAGVLFYVFYLWACINDPEPGGSAEERHLQMISIACFVLAFAIVISAVIT